MYPLDSITHPLNVWGPKPNTGAPPPTPLPPPLQVVFDIHLHQMANTIRPKWCPFYLTEGEYNEAVSIFPQAASLAEFFKYKPFAASLGTKLTSWRSRNAPGQDTTIQSGNFLRLSCPIASRSCATWVTSLKEPNLVFHEIPCCLMDFDATSFPIHFRSSYMIYFIYH